VSSKKETCGTCGGKGKLYVYNLGTVISSDKCPTCKGTGKVPKQINKVRA